MSDTTHDATAAHRAASDAAELAASQLAKVEAEIVDAKATIVRAQIRLADVVNDTDPGASLAALDAAEGNLTRLLRLSDAMQASVAGKRAEAVRCWGETFRPDYDRGVAGRIAACAKADAARAALAQAQAQFDDATAMIQRAFARGMTRPTSTQFLGQPMGTEAEERAMHEAAR